jgi:hypothetical protein
MSFTASRIWLRRWLHGRKASPLSRGSQGAGRAARPHAKARLGVEGLESRESPTSMYNPLAGSLNLPLSASGSRLDLEAVARSESHPTHQPFAESDSSGSADRLPSLGGDPGSQNGGGGPEAQPASSTAIATPQGTDAGSVSLTFTPWSLDGPTAHSGHGGGAEAGAGGGGAGGMGAPAGGGGGSGSSGGGSTGAPVNSSSASDGAGSAGSAGPAQQRTLSSTTGHLSGGSPTTLTSEQRSVGTSSASPSSFSTTTSPSVGTSSTSIGSVSTRSGPGISPLSVDGITADNAPGILPLVFDTTASDPARELVQVTAASQGQNPMSEGFSDAGIRYVDGTIYLTGADLSSTGFGNPWGQTRNWTNGTGYATTNINGNGWIDSQMPYLQKQSTSTIALITSGTNAMFFDWNGTAYMNRWFFQNTLVDNTTAQEFQTTDNSGKIIRFYDFSAGIPTAQQGTFKSLTDQNGDVLSVTAHNASGKIQEVQSSSTVGSTTITESYLYTYIASGTNAGLLQNVLLRRQVNGGAWANIRQVAYTYYDGTQSYGNAGDLQKATIEDGSGNAIDTWYYRYYVTETGGFQHALKYEFSPASYSRLVTAVTNPLTATDAQVSPYADLFLQYNASKQVSQAVVQGAGSSLGTSNVGLGTYSYAYTASANTADYNNWAEKTVETLPDGNTNTVYTNAFGEVMLKAYHDVSSGNTWDTYFVYDGAGRISEAVSPSRCWDTATRLPI